MAKFKNRKADSDPVIEDRIQFCRKLARLKAQNAPLIWIDETTFQLTGRPYRTWMAINKPITAPHNDPKLISLTVYGAVSNCLREPVFQIGTATNKEQFCLFLERIKRQVRNPYSVSKPHLCLDNHKAHHSHVAKRSMERLGFR